MKKIKSPSSDSLFRILHAASFYETKLRKQRSSSADSKFVSRLFIELTVFPFILSVILAAIAYFTEAMWLIYSSIIGLLIAYIGVLVHPLISAWLNRELIRKNLKHPFGIVLRNSALTTAVDLKYLPYLEKKPLNILEVVALEVKAEREFFERRISLVVGAIEKLGLAPGLLAVFLSLHKLPNDTSPWIAALAYATPALYLFAVMAHYLAMRLDRMNKLLDLAIAHRKEKKDSVDTSIHRVIQHKATRQNSYKR
ncbi:hypothetical protein [Comamonas sp.]|uniref:hypothetical protein n=1 Tax=Comamonas sp. TaxID=34028 RepID=UPI0026473FB8|nr:hypothetical protein [Comamonas sp.]MDN5537829.1 hypothetical protein [Comamonas sp.]